MTPALLPAPLPSPARHGPDPGHPVPILVFLSLRAMVDYAEADRAAFNRTFAVAGLDWHWTPEDTARLPGGDSDLVRLRAAARARNQIVPAADLAAIKARILQGSLRKATLRLTPGADRALAMARATAARLVLVTAQPPGVASRAIAATRGAPTTDQIDVLFRRADARAAGTALVLRLHLARLGGLRESIRALGACPDDMGVAARAGLVAHGAGAARTDA